MSLYRIDKLFNFEKGTLQSSKCEPGSYTFITASAEWKTHNNFSYDCEALVFAAAASGSLGRTHYVNGKFIASDLCFVLTPKDPAKFPIDLRFYHIIFNELRSDIVKNTKAGTSKEAISLGNFARYELPYFEIEKQIEIKKQFVHSEKIKETLTAELARQLDFVKQLRQAFLREAMQGKLTPQDPKDEPASELLQKIKAALRQARDEKKGKKQKEHPPVKEDEIPFEIPENWVWCRLGEICDFENGDRSEKYPSGTDIKPMGIPFINSKTIINNKIDLESPDIQYISKEKFDSLRSGKLKVRDLAMVLRGATRGKVGLFNGNEIHKTGFVNAQLIIIRNDECVIDRSHLLHYFDSPLFKSNVIDITSGSAQPHFSGTNLEDSLIPLPPLSEQHRIVAKLEQLMQYCDDLEQSIRQSKEQTSMLLQVALKEALKGKGDEAPKK